jgi:hypothetical protein
MKELRNKSIQLRVSETELKIIDRLRDKLQIVTPRQKVSRTDAILKAIEHADGKLF